MLELNLTAQPLEIFPSSSSPTEVLDGKCQREQDFLKVILSEVRLWSYLMPAEMLLCI